jgi:hypothetical protein
VKGSLAEKRFTWMKQTTKKFKFFTGLSEFLDPEAHALQYWGKKKSGKRIIDTISFECQLAMTLWRL